MRSSKDVNIPLVYEDQWYVIANKPPGLLTIPSPRGRQRTLTAILNDHTRSQGYTYRLHPCHRLDRETSGLIIYAKGRAAQRKMMSLFKDRAVHKEYYVLAQGKVSPPQGIIRRSVGGERAVTRYRVLKEYPFYTLLKVEPETGRKNQIRLHLKSMGHPLVGETRFALRRRSPVKAKRVCLHAYRLRFSHPFTGKTVFVEAPLTRDMEKFLS